MALQDQLLAEQSKLAELGDEMDAISGAAESENRELTEDELKLLNEYPAKIDKCKARCESLEKAITGKARMKQRRTVPAQIEEADRQIATTQATVRVPARVGPRSRYFAKAKDAYDCGMWLAATLGSNNLAKQYCRENQVGGWSNAMEEGTDSAGGYSVPDPLAATILELIEQFGVFRANARNVPMTSDTLRVPKLPEVPRTGRHPDSSLTVYYPDEGAAITASDMTFEQVSMAAVKYAQLAIWSTELNEDAVISMTDLLARDIARNFAYAEDLNSFIGDGTATYGTITGVLPALQAGATVTLAATNTAATDITLNDLNSLIGILSDYPGLQPKYYMSKDMYWNVVVPLLQAAGGTNMPQIEMGPNVTLNGYPVVITQVLPGAGAAAGSDVILCGDLDLGAYCATRRNVSVRVLTELYAASDQLGIVATMRGDSVTHSVGDADNCGALSKLALAAS